MDLISKVALMWKETIHIRVNFEFIIDYFSDFIRCPPNLSTVLVGLIPKIFGAPLFPVLLWHCASSLHEWTVLRRIPWFGCSYCPTLSVKALENTIRAFYRIPVITKITFPQTFTVNIGQKLLWTVVWLQT